MSVGAYDLESGLAANTLSVTLDVAVGGAPAGTNFAAGVSGPANGGVVSVPLPAAVDLAALEATLTVRIADEVGQVTEIVRTYSPSYTPPHRTYLPVVARPASASIDAVGIHKPR